MTSAELETRIAEEDRLRADLYDFLGRLLAAPPDQALLDKSAALSGDESELGRAIRALSRVASATTPQAAESEYTALFIGVGRGELLPYTSYYLTGFLNEKPLAALRDDMRMLGIGRSPDVYEPEDHIASLLEMMAGMITGRFGKPVSIDRSREFFDKHIGPWAGHFFTDLEGAKNSVFYAPVGSAGRVFMEIEKEAFQMTAG
ncbi:MAG: molecular chaperone TorD family protein [Alphaproteobacteria bacterium]|nr:molecular chaperone TorD family protein [Alphaproteobacteria bacterium]MCY4499293.1 molecular chaperone TorD family protein [Rhodospirillaceae bacterium]